VGYLGHIISDQGVAVDSEKIKAITAWPQPATVKHLKGFLGFAGYYRKFIKHFGTIAKPLTQLLKDSFRWTELAMTAFEQLKFVLSTAPVLQLPDFNKPFVVECDASSTGFGAVLHQGIGPIAFFSRMIAPRHAKLAAYERELIGLVTAVKHWRPYLWGRPFIIRSDHYSLKYILDQRLSTIPQHHWVSKLLGYDFTVEYKPGKHNTVADALSRRDATEPSLLALSEISFPIFDQFKVELTTNEEASILIASITKGELSPAWTFEDGLILFS
jgi:hypothetical protein